MRCVLFGTIFVTFFAASLAISCTQRYQCAAYSQDYNYVDCVGGQCACLNAQGFVGNATSQGICSCASGNTVIWQNNQPYCLNLARATQLQVNETRGKILIDQAKLVYTSLIYPTPLFILNGSINLDNLFAPGVIGRVDPLGIFTGVTLQDYFYVFAVTPGIAIPSVNFVNTAVNFNGPAPKVSIRVDITFAAIIAPGVFYPVLNITQSGDYTFAPNNTIIAADLILHNLGVATELGIINRTAFVTQLCNDILASCTPADDPLGYYHDFGDCYNFMFSSSVRQTTWGGTAPVTYDQPAGNTQICRRVHASIAKYTPAVHCPHAGKTGGGQCSDDAGLFGPNPGPYTTNYYNNVAQPFY